jgi:hypothetical protein
MILIAEVQLASDDDRMRPAGLFANMHGAE